MSVTPSTWRKLAVSLFAVLLILLAGQGSLDAIGRDYTEAGLKRALITYGIARGLNGVISVAQGTELAFEPAGIGVVLAPGQILDPINDLIERFSWVMLASATSLGIQRVLLNVTAWPLFTLLVAGCVLLALCLMWWRPALTGWRTVLYRITAVLLIIRFAVPVIAILNEGLYSYFLEPQYTASREQLELKSQEIGELNAQARGAVPPPENGSWLDAAKRGYQQAADALNIERRLEALKRVATELSEHAINLIVVFSLQTILFPLLFLWLALQLMKLVARARYT